MEMQNTVLLTSNKKNSLLQTHIWLHQKIFFITSTYLIKCAIGQMICQQNAYTAYTDRINKI